jgi:hypothetical protein
MIRFTNTRTGKSIAAKDGKDAALLAKIELDRRSGIELGEAERKNEAQEQARGELQARLSA